MSDDVVHVPTAFGVGDGAGRLAVKQCVDAYLSTLQSARSRSTMREALDRAARAYGRSSALDVPWPTLGLQELGALRIALAYKYAPSTANATLSAVRRLLSTAFVLGMTTERQYAALGLIKSVSGSRLARGRSILRDEERRMLAFLGTRKGWRAPMLRAAMTLSIGGGLRREELCQLALAAYVPPVTLEVLGKGNRERKAMCDGGMRYALEEWLDARSTLSIDHGAMFCCPDTPDRPLSTQSWWLAVRAAADACDVKCSGPHDFRRTFATRLLEAGVDLLRVQKLMGHADPSTTGKYDHRLIKEAYDARLAIELTTVDVP